MPRKTKSKRGKSRVPKPNDARDRIVRVPFHVFQANTGATTYAIVLQPASFQRELAVADAFELYRFVELGFRLVPGSSGVGACAAGYLPGITDTAPATVGAVGGILKSVMLGSLQSVPSSWCKLGYAELRGFMNWYKSIAGTPDPADEQQGTIYFAADATAVAFTVEIFGICEFRGAAPTGSTPAMRLEAILAKEYQRQMFILAAGGAAAAKLKLPPKCAPPTG